MVELQQPDNNIHVSDVRQLSRHVFFSSVCDYLCVCVCVCQNRKNDEASYEKMLRLRREFSRTVTILEMIKRREKSKRELLHLTLEVVERR